jgi:FkbM family methyltransferase
MQERSSQFDDYDSQTFEVMRRVLHKSANCIDVGCHVGSILVRMIDLAPEGYHFAFEPLPDCFRLLWHRFGKLPRVALSNVALSDVAGERKFQYVVSNPAYSGFLKRRYDRPYEEVVEVNVTSCRLDEVIPKDVPINFIKIDVEGAELEVLRGGVSLITQNSPTIVFEHGLGAADYYGTNPEDIYDFLVGSCGLRLTLMRLWLEQVPAPEFTRQEFSEHFWRHLDYYFLAFP